ncbi:peptidylprolyl isomerase [Xylanimonas oleitrophica]|uniref:Peptidylprolyl isomerase n=1 Tax=Xylanimonas oleitrophica TaxID=2607479 RepID=A0A2W5Y495_9MICO|nr:peptidylprolyl isomerase [Xylanimonas oleitrophica]PZR52734.1 peptidylprolyl isomerase [Xylanimonas oleitrophica]
MAPSKREREYARKRQAKWEERRARARARRQRTAAIVAGAVVVALVGAFLVVGLVNSGQPQGADAATAAPTPAQTSWQCPPGSTSDRTGGGLPDPASAEGRTWTATLDLCAGDDEEQVTLELDGAAAPQAVASFVALAQAGYFDGTGCHRLTTAGIYVLQCGDPTMTGTGGPGYSYGPIENAPADDVYPAGTLAMARQGGNGESMGSQFFLVYQDSTIPSDAAGGYTVFGRVTSGLEVLQAVADAGVADGASDGSPAIPVTIEGVETK